jgi:hypothetical protein
MPPSLIFHYGFQGNFIHCLIKKKKIKNKILETKCVSGIRWEREEDQKVKLIFFNIST